MANRTSHRYNHLPLLSSDPGGVQQELVVPICRRKIIKFYGIENLFEIEDPIAAHAAHSRVTGACVVEAELKGSRRYQVTHPQTIVSHDLRGRIRTKRPSAKTIGTASGWPRTE